MIENEQKHSENRKHIYISHALNQMLQIEAEPETGYFWHNEAGHPTTDPAEIAEKIPVQIPRFRPAETDNDFQIIFEKELANSINPEKFKEIQIEDLREKIDLLQKYNRLTFRDIILRADLYVRFLERKTDTQTAPETIENKGLTMPEIALICIYTGQHIDSEAANQILKKYNPKLTSQRKLIEHYNHFQTKGNRVNLSENETKDKTQEKRLTKVVEYLEKNELNTIQAKDELQKLSKEINKKY